MKSILFGIIIFFCFVASVHAQKDILLDKVLKDLAISPKKIDPDLTITKQLPNDKTLNLYLIAIPDIKRDYTDYDIYILLVDNVAKKIVSKIYEKTKWTSDALHLDNVIFDTAPYNIAPGVRAFGVRATFGGSSRPNPFEDTNLSLYIRKENTLVKVLNEFAIYKSSGEWDMDCAGEFETEEKTLVITKNPASKFNDILVKSKITNRINTKIKEDCVESTKVKNTTGRLIYNSGKGVYELSK